MEMNEKKNSISAMMEASMGKIREMVDSNTVVGEPIVTADGVTLIPVSRLSFGVACGGSDFATKGSASNFGGGGASSAKVEPVAFLVVRGDSVRLISVDPPVANTVDRIVDAVPEVMDRVTAFIQQQQERKDKKAEQSDFVE